MTALQLARRVLSALGLISALLGLASPASAQSLLDMADKLDQLDRLEIREHLDASLSCTDRRNFTCAEERLARARKVASTAQHRQWVALAERRLADERAAVVAEARAREAEAQRQRDYEREQERAEERRIAREERQERLAQEQQRMRDSQANSSSSSSGWGDVMQHIAKKGADVAAYQRQSGQQVLAAQQQAQRIIQQKQEAADRAAREEENRRRQAEREEAQRRQAAQEESRRRQAAAAEEQRRRDADDRARREAEEARRVAAEASRRRDAEAARQTIMSGNGAGRDGAVVVTRPAVPGNGANPGSMPTAYPNPGTLTGQARINQVGQPPAPPGAAPVAAQAGNSTTTQASPGTTAKASPTTAAAVNTTPATPSADASPISPACKRIQGVSKPAAPDRSQYVKEVVSEGSTGDVCWGEKVALDFAYSDARNKAYGACSAMGYMLEREPAFKGYEQCVNCRTANERGCKVTQAVYRCFNSHAFDKAKQAFENHERDAKQCDADWAQRK